MTDLELYIHLDDVNVNRSGKGKLGVAGGKVLGGIVDIDTKLTTSIQSKGRMLQEGTGGSNEIRISSLDNRLGLFARSNRAHSNNRQARDTLADARGIMNLIPGRIGDLLERSVSGR